jgi:LysM repeat protein
VPPSATPTAEANAPTPTETFVLPTAIVLPSELELPSIDELLIPVPTDLACGLPPGWTIYTVRRGDNLFAIAEAVGSSVNQLREVNCLENVANLQVDDVLFVPRLPTMPVATAAPVFPQSGLAGVGCTDPNVQLIVPSPGIEVSGLFGVGGTASAANFQFYRLEVRPNAATRYSWYSSSTTPVVSGFLGNIDTTLFGSGLHWIRLVVVDTAGNSLVPCAIPVIFR